MKFIIIYKIYSLLFVNKLCDNLVIEVIVLANLNTTKHRLVNKYVIIKSSLF